VLGVLAMNMRARALTVRQSCGNCEDTEVEEGGRNDK
jgi:hypothetical protein